METTINAPPGRSGRAVIRIVARRVPWPTLSQRSDRSGLRLRWSAFTEGGDLLVEATEHPLADGAHVLLSQHGQPGDTVVTLRHEGKSFDSFVPRPLHLVAAEGGRRAEGKARLAEMRARHPENSAVTDAAGGHPPAAHAGLVLAGGAA